MNKILFILDYEEEFDWITLDSMILKGILDDNKEKYSYVILNNDSFFDKSRKLKKKNDFPNYYQNGIPVGSIEFVNNFINIFKCEFNGEISIEVPPCLRKYKYLKRQYKILPYSDFPLDNKNYFIKDAVGVKNYNNTDEYDDTRIDKNNLFVLSEKVNILSEYRIYVIRGKIKNICCYKGDPTLFPNLDLVKEMLDIYMKSPDFPQSISIDVLINEFGTSLLEIHSFSSLGLYSTKWDNELPLAFIDGFNYLLNINTKQTPFCGFSKELE